MSQRFESGSLNQNMSMESSTAGMNDFRPELHVAQQSLRDDFRQESHVAQQSRRDKLRVQQNPAPVHHIQDFSNHLVQLPRDLGLNHDLIQVRNVRNCNSLSDPTMFSSEMHNFSTNNTHVLLAHKDAIMQQESCDDQPSMPQVRENSSFGNFNASAKASDPRNPCYWKDLESQRSYDWIVNYANGSGSNACNQYPSFVGGILSGTVKENNISASTHQCLKPGYNGYQVVRSPLSNPSGEISSQDGQKKQVDKGFNSSLFYQNPLQDVVTSSTIGSQELDMASLVRQNIRESGHGSWVDGGNELLLLPTYADQINVSRLNNPGAWMHRPVEGSHQGNAGLGFTASKSEGNIENLDRDSTAQGLSLSLSSHHPELYAAQCGERFGSKDLQCRTGIFSGSQDLKSINPSRFCLNSKLSIDNKGYENSIQGIASSSMYAHRSTGPLGPFTGYATILKSSKFLKPAQQLLDEFCSVTDAKVVKTHEMPEKCSGDATILHDAMNSENEIGGREGGYGIGSCQSYGPEFQRKKAKLLYMQEEVCRRYKQYHQQMQIVVSSFESVAGLSAATPYISLALKSISRHFKCMKNAISDQLQHVSKALGENMSSPTTGASSKDHTATQRLRYINSGLGKHKYAGDSHAFLEPQQHVWRPHRGLPERSVAILRAWLFEHFLHPYPTDTDKHLLATQTGLSRNQVSNWFINARVRVWKPMVEEVHMLETKGSAAMVLDSRKNDGETSSNSGSGPSGDQASNKTTTNAMSDKQSECPAVTPMANSNDEWRGCQIQGHMDGGLIGFMPYHQSGLEIGGLGAVSLTLGLRHSTENAQQQLQQQKSRD